MRVTTSHLPFILLLLRLHGQTEPNSRLKTNTIQFLCELLTSEQSAKATIVLDANTVPQAPSSTNCLVNDFWGTSSGFVNLHFFYL